MWRLSHCHSNTNFNPRSPHGERLLILSICTPPVVISIHAPRTGSDSIQIARIMYEVISIHAPRTGSDDLLATSVESLAIFQSTLPARGATRGRIFKRFPRKISIHAPRTGSDSFRHAGVWYIPISIHAPRTGSDFQGGACRYWFWHFNPRSPHGERRSFHFLLHDFDKHFNPRSPHGERRPQTSPCKGGWDFNPRSPHGERRQTGRFAASRS